MVSRYLQSLSADQRQQLIRQLWEQQRHNCLICGDPVDLDLHHDQLDIDHIEPLSTGGKDDPGNFGLTHQHCNRTKLASDLRIARMLARLERVKQRCLQEQNRGPNLGDILQDVDGAKFEVRLKRGHGWVEYSFPETGDNQIHRSPLYSDPLSSMEYFFGVFPIEYLHHDPKINPRAIGTSLRGLLEEFHKGRPQLHVGLAWLHLDDGEDGHKVHVFDGQHKAAAQIMLGVRFLPIRVFLDADLDVLLQTNANAGDQLRQVAFDKSVKRMLGSSLYLDRIQRYQRDHGMAEGDFGFSERALVTYFKGEALSMRRYVLDAVRSGVTFHPQNRLMDYVDLGGRGKERPLSYSSVEKTFYSFFIFPDVLDVPLDYRMDQGENPRELEKEQIVRLMNIIAEEIYVGQFDPAIGTDKIESHIQQGEDVPEPHLRAFRMSKEEIIYNWLRFVRQIAQNYFIWQGVPVDEKRLFQYRFPEPLWDRIRAYVRSLRSLSLWVNRELSLTVFGAKQNYGFWQAIFETGCSPQGQQVMPKGLNLMEMIKE